MTSEKTFTFDNLPQEVQVAVRSAAKGCYQINLLNGIEKWSGASLKGRARRYSTRYAISRRNFLYRIDAAVEPFGYEAFTDLILDTESRRWKRKLIFAQNDTDTDL